MPWQRTLPYILVTYTCTLAVHIYEEHGGCILDCKAAVVGLPR